MSTGNIGLGALADTIAEGAIARMQAGQPDRRLIRAQDMQSHQEAFVRSGANHRAHDYLRSTREAPLSRYEIRAGWEIPAALEQSLSPALPDELKADRKSTRLNSSHLGI